MACRDTRAVRSFYTGLFGWTAEEPQEEFGGYFMFNGAGGQPVAGCMPAMEGGAHDVWSVYLTVEDVSKTLGSVPGHGGQVIVPAMQVGQAGTMAVALDPAGAAIGLWQADQFGGIANAGEPGLPSWFELHARAYDAQTVEPHAIPAATRGQQPCHHANRKPTSGHTRNTETIRAQEHRNTQSPSC